MMPTEPTRPVVPAATILAPVVAFALAPALAAVLALAPAEAAAQSGGDGRISVRAEDRGGTGAAAGYVGVRVGDEVRSALAPSERQLLTFAPAQVAAGGRIFAFGKIPTKLGGEAFTAEFLVWEEGAWRRRGVIPRQAGQVGHVSASIVVPDIESGSVPTAVFARRRPGEMQTVRSTYVTVPASSRLHLGYSLDEWDWRDLGPVSVRVAAQFAPGQRNAGRSVELFSKRIVPGKADTPRWFDETIDLGVVGGQVVRFVFTAVPERAAGKLAPYVVWAAPKVVASRGATTGRGVVMISLDGVRARSLSCCGASREVSPFMDGLFKQQGVVFDHAIAQAVQSVPSTMTLFTGLYPSVHQVLGPRRSLGEDVEPLALVLARAGFATAAFADGVAMSPEVGFGRGFDTFVQTIDSPLWDVDGRAGPTFDRALEWIERNADQPFFVWIQTRQARSPHVPPRGYETLFRDSVDVEAETAKGIEGLRVRYDREIRYLDDTVSRFVNRLDALSNPGRTLLVVTSAHGEEFLEHGALGNGTQLYDESIRVPLLMRGAGLRPGQRYGEVIGLIDVAPTVLGIVDVPVPTVMQGDSVAQALRSGLPYSLPPRYSEAHATRRRLAGGKSETWSAPAFAVTDAGRKLILTPGADGGPRLEAYDTLADPEETSDLLAAPAAVDSAVAIPPAVVEDATNAADAASAADADAASSGDAAVSPDGAAAPAAPAPPAPAALAPPPGWVGDLRGLVENYPTLCRQVAREKGPSPTLPAAARVRLRAFGYLD